MDPSSSDSQTQILNLLRAIEKGANPVAILALWEETDQIDDILFEHIRSVHEDALGPDAWLRVRSLTRYDGRGVSSVDEETRRRAAHLVSSFREEYKKALISALTTTNWVRYLCDSRL